MTLIAEQTVKARPVEAALGKTRSGKEQVAVLFEILDGTDIGRSITWYGYFTEKTTEHTLDALEACGWNGENIADLSGLDRDVRIKIEHEDGQDGVTRARVRYVNALGGGLALQSHMDPGDAASFAQKMKGTLLARKQAKGQAPASSNNAKRREQPLRAESRREDDDIPF